MKKFLVLSTAFISVLLFTNCSRKPEVGFSTDKETFKIGEQISFINESEDADDYLWNFGDGQKSSDHNPKHTYSSVGDFTVTLTATNSAGSATATRIIHVEISVTGMWKQTLIIDLSGYLMKTYGTMNITQNDDNTLSGNITFTNDTYYTFNSDSKLSGKEVTIGWTGSTYKFVGTVSDDGQTMSGTLTSSNYPGTWTAVRL